MGNRIRKRVVALAFEGFHPRLWVLAFIALVFISIAWLDIMRPPPIRLPRFSLSDLLEETERELDSPKSERAPLFTSNYSSTLTEGVTREIGECVRVAHIDVDGDFRRERVCVRVATYEVGGGPPREVLLVDIHKGNEWLLRQELSGEPFRGERVLLLRDLDMDGSAELVTQLASNPERPDADVGRIYKFDGYAFVEALNIFGLPPQDASVVFFLRHLEEIQAEISVRYSAETGNKDLCTDSGDEGDCFAGSPWLLDSNSDGRLELVQLLEPPGGGDASKAGPFRLFVKEFRRRSMEGRSRFHPIGPVSKDPMAGTILFQRSTEGRLLLLASFTPPGDKAAARAFSGFEISGTGLRKAAGIGGFKSIEGSMPLGLADTKEALKTR